MQYQVVIPKPVQKQLDDLSDDVYDRIIEADCDVERAPTSAWVHQTERMRK